MIKVELERGANTTKLYFESRGESRSDLDVLDEVYRTLGKAIMFEDVLSRLGFVDSSRFYIEVHNEKLDSKDA